MYSGMTKTELMQRLSSEFFEAMIFAELDGDYDDQEIMPLITKLIEIVVELEYDLIKEYAETVGGFESRSFGADLYFSFARHGVGFFDHIDGDFLTRLDAMVERVNLYANIYVDDIGVVRNDGAWKAYGEYFDV